MIKTIKPSGFYSGMTNEEFYDFAKRNCKGMGLTEFGKNNRGAYDVARERGLIGRFVEAGILVRGKEPNGFYSGMTYNQFCRFIKENHQGGSITEFIKSNGSAYNIAHERGWIDNLVEEGILIRKIKKCEKKRPYMFYSKISDDELYDYVKKNFNKKTISELSDSDSMAYRVTNKRGLIGRFVNDGILIRKKNTPENIKSMGFFSKMGKKELGKYVNDNHKGKSITEFYRDDGSAYDNVLREGMIDELVKDDVLVRKKTHNRISSETMEEIIELLKESGKSYKEIGRIKKINDKTIRKMLDNAIKNGILDPRYKRPNGQLYLENVRNESIGSLEGALQNDWRLLG